MSSAFAFTHFPSNKIATDGRRLATTWDVLDQVFLLEPQPREVPKDKLALWCPATFKDDHRTRANVEAVYALGFDVDVAPVPNESDLRTALAGQSALIHASSSHTPTSPRWRLLLQLSRAITGVEYDVLWRFAAERLPFKVGQEAKDPSRGWFMPRQPDEGDFVGFVLPGACPVPRSSRRVVPDWDVRVKSRDGTELEVDSGKDQKLSSRPAQSSACR